MDCLNPTAFRSLLQLRKLDAKCHCCGNVVQLLPEALRRVHRSGVRTYGALWERAYCPGCRALGHVGTRIILTADWIEPPEIGVTILSSSRPATTYRGRRLPPKALYAQIGDARLCS